jgi:tubulin polyglutamylase TTLL9
MATDRNNSFELYGFDILLNSKLEPWLIEVNGSPSMTANTEKDNVFKLGLLDDTLSVIDMEKL